jgi:Zn-dependent protease with chaperone function
MTSGLVTAAYSREAEAAADLYAAELMTKLGRSPAPLGDLLMRIDRDEKTSPLEIVATHPMTSERRAALASYGSELHGPPLLGDTEWQALKTICE